jgi:hypothetical protein
LRLEDKIVLKWIRYPPAIDWPGEMPYFAESIFGEGKVISLKNLNLSSELSIIDNVKKNLIFSNVTPDSIDLNTLFSNLPCLLGFNPCKTNPGIWRPKISLT